MTALADSPEIPYLSPFGLYAHLGLVRVMEPETEVLMMERAHHQLAHDDYDSPHARAWHVSFHASEFPGDPEDACQRYLVYRMMNVPADKPMPPWVTTTGTVGKAGELDIADAWFQGGRMLAVPEDETEAQQRLIQIIALMKDGQHEAALELAEKPPYHQLGFVDESVWMTASTDLPILPFGWTRPHIVEVKCKAHEVIEEMMKGRWDTNSGRLIPRGPDTRHVRQLKATLGLAHEYDWGSVAVCGKCWFIYEADIFERLIGQRQHPLSDSLGYCPRCKDYDGESVVFDLDPPVTGEIYYWSRSWPRQTRSFYYEYDPSYINGGREILAGARQHFLDETLPPRPNHFQWSVGPCADCSFRPSCRLDSGLAPRKRKPVEKDIVHVLPESNAIKHAQSLRPHYDYGKAREAVLAEWNHG